jgi:hypothetical protein
MVMLFSKYVPALLSALTPHPPPRSISSELAQEVVLRRQIPQLIQPMHSQTTKRGPVLLRHFARKDEAYGSMLLIAFPVSLQAASGRSP